MLCSQLGEPHPIKWLETNSSQLLSNIYYLHVTVIFCEKVFIA